jgi:hypothetical protein
VKRIAENPGLLKLTGKKREITALFTDIENFTAMTHRAGPEQLVAVLDEYIEGMAAIVMKHGGMVDKIVGDSVHAFFNAPLDLDDHPQRAIDCAEEMRIWARAFQSRPGPSEIGFGRTRIGIETGDAIVGDIGIKSKLDYTAHGDSINSAARLEALNKRYGWILLVDKPGSDSFSEYDQRALAVQAAQAGRIYENGSLYARVQEQVAMLLAQAQARERDAGLLRLEHNVARALAAADTIENGLATVIQAVCESQRWDVGRLWKMHEEAGVLRLAMEWFAPDVPKTVLSLPGATVRAKIPSVARSALSGITGKMAASFQACSAPDQS